MSTHVATVPLVSPAPSRVEPLVVDLRSLPRAGAVGGKAWNLGRIVSGHAPVPPAVVLTAAAFDAFLDAAGLRAR
ncbi:MAG: PEP/pyruvate-binding domain-containing protein, partial [Vicinamibacterales bacterium]